MGFVSRIRSVGTPPLLHGFRYEAGRHHPLLLAQAAALTNESIKRTAFWSFECSCEAGGVMLRELVVQDQVEQRLVLFSRFGAARMASFASWKVRPTARVARECAI